MLNFLKNLFDSSDFTPRRYCGDWSTALVGLHIVSDVLIWIAYLTIPVVLISFARRRHDLPFPWMFWMFAAFIISCGFTHFLEAAAFCWPAYRLMGMVKLITAAVSWATVIALVPLVPMVLALRTPKEFQQEIDERKRAEEVLRERTAQLETAQKELEESILKLQRTERMAILGQVAGGVAHELRNPLNVIHTSVYYLLNARNPTPDKKVDHLKRIERNVKLADNVITSLSTFARSPLPTLLPIAIEPFVRETLEINAPGQAIEVAVDCPAGLPHALGDRDQLRIVLGNLIRNARDAMSAGGRLAISAAASDGVVELAVADTGVGIETENLARIMEPLYSTKASGLGLGLAISRSIVEKNQGSLRVTSEPGRGSTFTIRLLASPSEVAGS
jgi:signal transduction histidine kinase